MTQIISDETATRFITEITTAAGPLGLTADDINAASDTLIDLLTSAATIKLWAAGEITFGWNTATRDLVLMKASK